MESSASLVAKSEHFVSRAAISSLRPPAERVADDVARATAMLDEMDHPMSRLRKAITSG